MRAGNPLQLNGTVADVAADTHTAVLNPGDGTAPVPVTVTDGTLTVRHTYVTAGTRTMTVTVIDDDGGRVTASVAVTVQAVERVLAPATITLAGSVAVPDSGTRGKPDQIGLAGVVVASKGSTLGIIGIVRTGTSPMALGSISVKKAGTWTEGGVRYGTVIGSGVLGSGKTARAVTYELTVADGKPDKVWLTVKDAAGAVIPGLTVGGAQPTQGLTFSIGSATVTPR